MKGKFLIILLSIVCVMPLFSLAACDDGTKPVEHTHNYEWIDNGDGTHKQHCSGSDCDEPDIDVGNHDFSSGDCVCGAEKPVEVTEGLEYSLNDDGESYSVTGIGSASATYIVIAEEYEGKPVTSIGDSGFNRDRDTAKNQENQLKQSLSRA